jgi:hypothetical protein
LRTGPLFYSFSLIPLAGILIAGLGVGDKRRHWLLLVGLGVFLLLLSACGGGGSSGTAPGGTTYNVQVQATTAAQANPVTITTAVLTVQ